jgi:hypothetical protein
VRREVVGFGLVWLPSNTTLILIHPDPEEGNATAPVTEEIVQWVMEHGREIARTSDAATQLRFRPYSELLGHSSVAITGDIYGHLTIETKREAVNRLGSIYADSGGG